MEEECKVSGMKNAAYETDHEEVELKNVNTETVEEQKLGDEVKVSPC